MDLGKKDSRDSKWDLVCGLKRRRKVLWQMKAKINAQIFFVIVYQKNS